MCESHVPLQKNVFNNCFKIIMDAYAFMEKSKFLFYSLQHATFSVAVLNVNKVMRIYCKRQGNAFVFYDVHLFAI